MVLKGMLGAALLGVMGFSSGAWADGAQDGAQLAKQKACFTCHAPEKRLVGPSFKEIAQKGAQESRLAEKIRKGGAGAWGQLPMPPNPVSESEALELARWVLSRKK